MNKVYLDVPYNEKDEAKALGARWDGAVKSWFIPKDIPIKRFTKWLQNYNGKITGTLYLIESTETCWKCQLTSKVYAIFSKNHTETCFDDDNGEPYEEIHDFPSTFSHIDHIDFNVLKAIRTITNKLFFDNSKTIGRRLLMNHCEHCSAKFGDFFMFNEPGGAFFGDATDRWTFHKLLDKGNYGYCGDYSSSEAFDSINI
ncbi:DUF5710 domain-containing protein [Deferribacteres bacterium DY0037]